MMKSFPVVSRIAAVTALTLLTASACTNSKSELQRETVSQSEAERLLAAGKLDEAADRFARIGELLLLPEGIEYADEMFDKALSVRPDHGKAGFYSSLTKPLLSMKGFITRVERVADAETRTRLEMLRSSIDRLEISELVRFANQLPTGQSPLKNFHELQRHLRADILPTLLRSADKLKQIDKGSPIELRINLTRLTGAVKHNYHYSYTHSSCYQASTGWTCNDYRNEYQYDSGPEDSIKADRYNVDSVDLKLMRGAVLAAADAIRLSTAYSLKGLENVIQKIEILNARSSRGLGNPTAREIVGILRSEPALFTLESDHELPALRRSLEETLRNALDFATLRNSLCGDSATRRDARRLIPEFCLTYDTIINVEASLALLGGPTEIMLGYDMETYQPIMILVDATRLLNGSVKDLKSFLPTRFTRSGDVRGFDDETFGGIFPNGDLIEKLLAAGRITAFN